MGSALSMQQFPLRKTRAMTESLIIETQTINEHDCRVSRGTKHNSGYI